MSEIKLDVRRREPGRSNARVLRRQSIVPGIYYYHGEEPIPVAAAELALRPLIYTTESHIVNMRLDDGTEKTCVLKDVVFDPITDRPTHFDLQGVAANEMINVEVPVNIIGQAVGQRDGGIVDLILHKLEIECIPRNLPEHIDVDITNLHIGESIHVRDLKIENITFLAAEDATIIAVTPPRIAVETEPTAVPEPEVIGKGKTEEA
jgi:large subunit ribosomal protein L25